MTKAEKMKVVRKLRRAANTRKSAEEGLEQEFNCLHAQRKALEALIASQRSEGWVHVEERWGGFRGHSGGGEDATGIGRSLKPEPLLRLSHA